MKWIFYVRYDPATGAILSAGKMQEMAYEEHLKVEPGHYLVSEEEVDLSLLLAHYVDVGTKTLKPKTDMALTVDGLTVLNIPPGAEATIDGEVYVVNDGVLELLFDLPGEHRVTLTHHKHNVKTITVVQA